ncbi:MAG: hypothetical protein ACP6KW_09540 [Candidatus Thorarchaeota archaeon]
MNELTINYWSPHGRQEETKFRADERVVNLVMRAALAVDLTGLRTCRRLEVLNLSHNMLETLDLTPLEGCSTIQELHLQDNHLTTVDLWPLAECDSLRSVELAANRLTRLDLTPLPLRCSVTLDSSVVVMADSILKYILRRDDIKKRVQLVRPDRAPWGAFPVVMWRKYDELHEKDWTQIRRRIMAVIRQLHPRMWYAAQRGLLEGLGLGELAGLDADPMDLVSSASEDLTFDDAVHTIESRAIELLDQQIQHHGPTLFLETDVIKKTGASLLLPRIIEARKREVSEAVVAMKGSKVFLRSLWVTHYGYQILQALGMGLRTDLEGLERIQTCFAEIGFDLRSKEMSPVRQEYSVVCSTGMRRHVFDLVLGRYS